MGSPISTQDALIYIMVVMAAVDTAMKDEELAQIGDLTRQLPVFAGFEQERLITVSRDCASILSSNDGLENILQVIEGTIPSNLADTAYALAVDIAAADLGVRQEEIRFLQLLRDRLGLDKLTCAAIERGAIARYRPLPDQSAL